MIPLVYTKRSKGRESATLRKRFLKKLRNEFLKMTPTGDAPCGTDQHAEQVQRNTIGNDEGRP
jgi:hypothetical protein